MSDNISDQKHAGTLAEVALALNAVHPAGTNLPAMVFMTDDVRVAEPVAAVAQLPPGCAVVFRHYGAVDRATLAAKVRDAARQQERLFLLAGDADLAEAVGADGLHLPEHMLRTLNKKPEGWRLVTAACHSAEALSRAATLQCDAAFLSPVFATRSHDGAAVLGLDQFANLTRGAALPVYALGGITNSTAPKLRSSGAVGLAAIGGLLR